MIQADERGGFRHAVSLNHGVTHALEKGFRIVRERGTAGDEGPELPAKTAMNAAKHPGAPKEFSPVGFFERAMEPRRFAAPFLFALQSSFQQIQHPRDGNKRGGAFALHVSNDFGGIRRGLENNGCAKQGRNKERHELSKHVTQRDERRETQGVKPALILSIFVDAALERLEVSEEIPVSQNDAARVGGRS